MRLFILLCFVCSAYSLNCFNCGVFLSASSPECRGPVTNTSCAPDNIGCTKIVGENADGTFYVEKRCAAKQDERDEEGCAEIGIRGIKATECFCRNDFCNSAPTLGLFPILSLSSFFQSLLF